MRNINIITQIRRGNLAGHACRGMLVKLINAWPRGNLRNLPMPPRCQACETTFAIPIALYHIHYTLYTVHCTLYPLQLYTVHCTLHTIQLINSPPFIIPPFGFSNIGLKLPKNHTIYNQHMQNVRLARAKRRRRTTAQN